MSYNWTSLGCAPRLRRQSVTEYERSTEPWGGPTVVHLCFGYEAVVSGEKPSEYGFLSELGDTVAQQISIEAAQPRLDLGVLRELAAKTIMLGVLDLGDAAVETASVIADRIRNGLRFVSADKLVPAPDCGMKYLARDTAFGKLKALAEGAAI